MRTYAIGVPRRVTRGARDNPWVTPGLGQSTSQPQATGSHSCTGVRAGARARPRLCPRGLHCALTTRPLNSLNVSPPPSLGDRVSSLRAALFAARTSRRLCRSTFQSSNLILFSQKIPAKFPGKLRALPRAPLAPPALFGGGRGDPQRGQESVARLGPRDPTVGILWRGCARSFFFFFGVLPLKFSGEDGTRWRPRDFWRRLSRGEAYERRPYRLTRRVGALLPERIDAYHGRRSRGLHRRGIPPHG